MNPSPAATLAALCVFNGLRLSPVFASPDSRLTLAGSPLSPRFIQCRNYLSRFFGPDSTPEDFSPLEFLAGGVAVSQWLRGAVGTLQHSLYIEHGIDVPDVASIDPAAWFDELDTIAGLLRDVEPEAPSHEMVEGLLGFWGEPDLIPVHPDSRAAYLAQVYMEARALQDAGTLLTSAAAIAKARRMQKPELSC